MKDYLAAVRRLPPSKQEGVLRDLTPVVERIEEASNLEWLPIEVNLDLTRAIFRELGNEGADVFFQNWLKRQMSAPLFAGLVKTAQALFRFETAATARWIPKAFDLMYRDYGTMVVEPAGPDVVSVQLLSMPPELVSHATWPRSVCSGLHALFFLTGVKGTAALDDVDVQQRTMRIALRWDALT